MRLNPDRQSWRVQIYRLVPLTRRVAVILFLIIPALAESRTPNPAPRPNILFLFSDDQRADTIHALGNPHIQTPNLDRLARAGTAFTQAHILGALQGAVCVPSRAMMLSGRSLFRVREDLRDTPTWPAQLGRAGWKTFLTGKWHNGAASLPKSFSEGHNVFLGGMTDQDRVKVRDLLPDGTLSPERTASGPSSETFADSAIRFLKDPRRAEQPFCLYVAFTSPHDPRTPPADFLKIYTSKPPPLPANFLAQHPFDNGEMTVRDEKLLPWPRTPEAVRQDLAAYYGMISHLDAQVGRILDALREAQLDSHTLVVFAGDNGLAMGSHGLLGKQNLYEHSMRVPLLVAGPGIPRNRRVGDLVTLHQLAATLCEYAGVPAPEGAEGRSLLPTWLEKRRSTKSPKIVLTAYRDIQRAVTDGRWKLIEYPKVQRLQLFDLRRDPDERRDLAAEPRVSTQRARLLELLREQQRLAGDSLTPRE